MQEHNLTNSILQKGVASYKSVNVEDVEIVDFKVTPGSNKGDNFSCIMGAVEITAKVKGGQEEILNWMAKMMPQTEMKKEFIEDSKMFDKESIIYTDMIPTLNTFLSNREIRVPKLHYGSIQDGVSDNNIFGKWFHYDYTRDKHS